MKQTHEFETMYREYFPRVYAFLYKLTGHRETAEELTQETFYQVFISFHRFRGDSEVFTYLASVAKHTYFKYQRKNQYHADGIDTDFLVDVMYGKESEHLEEEIERRMEAAKIRSIIDTLPTKYRDVTMLRIYADLSFSQIGSSMQISESSARVIYYRAKKMILEAMANEPDNEL